MPTTSRRSARAGFRAARAHSAPSAVPAAAIVVAAALAAIAALPSPAAVRADARRAAAQDVPAAMPAPGRIVYTRQDADTFDMFTADPDGRDERRLSDIDDSAAGEDQPRWAPDGRRLSFATYRDGRAAFHLIDAEGGPIRTVVIREGTSGDAAWSPDGRCLVFNGGRDDDENRFDLKIWCDEPPPAGAAHPNAVEGTLRRLTDTPAVDERDPAWSPDGTTIAFVARSSAAGDGDLWQLQTIRPDGSDRRTLATPPGMHVRFPRFDDRGERIGLIASRTNLPFGTLGVLDLASGAHQPLVELASDSWSWSPDGTELIFANIANGGIRLIESLAASLTLDVEAGAGRRGPVARRDAAGQQKGLYRIDVASRTVSRLVGPAGGADAPNVGTNFEFGFMPDWTAGTATPTAGPTDTPSATPEPSATPSPAPSATATVERTPTLAATPTRTASRGARIYLPRLFRTPQRPRLR